MTLFIYSDGADLGNQAVRLGPLGFSVTEAAESGTLAMSRIRVDDPAGSRTITGHRSIRMIETACSWDTLFRGYFADRDQSRGDSLRTGAARIWDATVYDLNAALQFEVIRGTGAKRPKETDTQRLAWLLGSAYTGPISSDSSAVFGAGDDLDKADYRGQTMADVLNDCATVSGCNYFVAWSDSVGAPVLHYYMPTRAYNSSSLRITNVLADIDMATVYAASADAAMSSDPSRVFSGVYFKYGDKELASVYETNATVLAAIGHKRETTIEDSTVNTAARATAKANRYLAEAETELRTIEVTLHKVRPEDVNLIRAGQRIEVKFTHLTGFTSWTWVRVARRTVRQDGDTQLFYEVGLSLVDPKQGGTKNRHKPTAPNEDAEPGAGAGTLSVTQLQSVHDTLKEDDWYGLFTAGAPYVGSWVSQNTPYTTAGCPLGGGLWGPGGITWEAWYTVTASGTAGDTGAEVTIDPLGSLLGLMASGGLVMVGWANAAPDHLNDFTPVGTIDPTAGGTVYVPGSLIEDGGTNYLVLAPNWRATGNWAICGNYITSSFGGPIQGGEANSGRGISVLTSEILITTIGNDSVGRTTWVTPIGSGDADGSNKVWTLSDWTGYGVPEARWGVAILSSATDYTWDRDALTVTFREPPPEGTRVAFRYRVGAVA